MSKMSELHYEKYVANGDLHSEIDLLSYELYVAKETIKDLRKVIPDYTNAERLFSADSISYLKSVGCAITNLKGTRYAY